MRGYAWALMFVIGAGVATWWASAPDPTPPPVGGGALGQTQMDPAPGPDFRAALEADEDDLLALLDGEAPAPADEGPARTVDEGEPPDLPLEAPDPRRTRVARRRPPGYVGLYRAAGAELLVDAGGGFRFSLAPATAAATGAWWVEGDDLVLVTDRGETRAPADGRQVTLLNRRMIASNALRPAPLPQRPTEPEATDR